MPSSRMKGLAGGNGNGMRCYQRIRAVPGEIVSMKNASETGGDVNGNTTSKRVCQDDGRSRVLMRQWLEELTNAGTVAGLQWLDQEHSLIRINWKHGSKSGWSKDDSEVFVKWAQYTASAERSFSTMRRIKSHIRASMGDERLSSLAIIAIERELSEALYGKSRQGRYDSNNNQFKRWKANFRCALRSLPDVKEVKDYEGNVNNASTESFKVFRLLEKVPRKRSKRTSESSSRTMSSSSSTSKAESLYTESSPLSSSPSQRVITLPVTCTSLSLDSNTGYWIDTILDPMQWSSIHCDELQCTDVPIPTFVEDQSVNEFSDDENDINHVDMSEIQLLYSQDAVIQSQVDVEELAVQVDENYVNQNAINNSLMVLLPWRVAGGSEHE